ncbi:MAG: polysaccharide deacetylase [Desulfobacula sp.]|jgi:peptidoglycan/xylan/chitin deacetylase (PgdA/CDA1 family)
MKPGVFMTFDVECSMGGAWQNPDLKPISPAKGMMGRYGKDSFGIPLICDILDRYGIKATFFLEPFNDELGYPGETEPVCRYLMDHGQDVQLHVHPGHYHYGCLRSGRPFTQTDQIADLPPDLQKQMISEGAERLTRWTGQSPIAFRAGNMGASQETLKILHGTGIWIDSSYTFPYVGGQCLFSETERYNGSRWYGDVLEVALSAYEQGGWPGYHGSKPVDLMGSSFEECRDAVQMICDAGADAVLILHSFSLFKVRDKQYNGGKLNRIVCRRFEKICEWLSCCQENYPARTFSRLGEMVQNEGYRPLSVEPCMLRRPLRAFTRKFIQGLNNFYWF